MNVFPKGRLVRTEVFLAVLLAEAHCGGSPEDRAPGEGRMVPGHSHALQRVM